VGEGEGGCCVGNPNERGRGGGGAWGGRWGAGGARAGLGWTGPGWAGLGWVGPLRGSKPTTRTTIKGNQSPTEIRNGMRRTRDIRQRSALRHDATPMALRFWFIHDTDTCHYTSLKLGRRSETGREKRLTPEFGERKEEKILPPNSGRYKPIPLKESRPRYSGLASKELRVFSHQIIFTLPGCFFLRVMIPSDFAHSDGLPSGDYVCSLKDLRWLLCVGQVLLEFKAFHWQLLLWHSQTLLQLRHMKNIMHIRQIFWQAELICHFSTPCENLIRTNVVGC
jgi:hypothetical protein